MPGTNSNVQLLTLLVDSADKDDSEYRFLVDSKHVKYITVSPGALPKEDRTFAPVLIPLLPPFPKGDWNEGHISKDHTTGQLFFAHHEKVELDGITHTWHPTHIDFLELKKLDRLRQNIQRVSHPLFDDTPIIFKFAEFPWQIPYFEAETIAYKWIEGQNIGPKFLGHVTEAGRVMGWVMEDLCGRAAEPGDLAACQEILGRLHALGIKHGDINRFNFIVRGDQALLVDFEAAEKCNNVDELEAEYNRLEQSLNDPSFRGGVGPATVSEQMPE